MDEENTSNPQSESQDIFPPSSTTEYVEESVSNTPNPTTETGDGGNKNKEPIKVIVNLPPEDKKPQIAANKIALISLWVNGGISLVLAFVTYLLFLKTQESNETSKDSLIVAQKALADSRLRDSVSERQDSITFGLSKKQFEEAIKNDSLSAYLNTKSLAAQVNSIKESQKQFDISHQPFLQVADFILSEIKEDKKLNIKYIIRNLSEIPVKIVSQKYTVDVGFKSIPISLLENAKIDKYYNSYLIKEDHVSGKITSEFTPSKGEVSTINTFGGYIFLLREITYRNLVTGIERVYRFQVKLRPLFGSEIMANNTYVEFIDNENFDALVTKH